MRVAPVPVAPAAVARALVCAGAFALASLVAPPAAANGRYPASNQLLVSPTDPNLVVLRATYGIVLSRDGGSTWQWLCEDVLGVSSSSTVDPVLAVTGNGSLVAGPELSSGLFVSADTGCSWSAAPSPVADQLIKDLAVRPDAPDVVVAVGSTYAPDAGADGGPGYAQPIYQSTDDGAHWSQLGAGIDPGAMVTTIEVASSDRARVYVSAVRGANATRTASLFVSTDGGAGWTERPVPLDATREAAIYIGAVDPTDADRVYVRTSGSTSRLLVTPDAGQTFTEALSLTGQMQGFALSPDGSKVFAGNAQQGLFAGSRGGGPLVNVSPVHVQCLATSGALLWACSDVPTGFIAGVSSDDGATFQPKLQLVAPPLLACAPDAATTLTCGGATRQAFCLSLGGCAGAPGDGGSPAGDGGSPPGDASSPAEAGASTGGGAASTTTAGKSCGCAAVGRGPAAAGLASGLGAVIALALRRRRRRPTPLRP